jgi:hypothetical protein
MPEWLIAIFVFYFIYLYLTMKTPKTPTEEPASKAKTEQPIATVVKEQSPKNQAQLRALLKRQKL